MKKLLNQSERRRLLAIEILYEQRDWITLASLAKMLDCSVRVLKDDVAHFKKHFEDFTIESSNNGVRLAMRNNAGLKTIYQYALNHSTAYNLLENIFLKEEMTIIDLTELLSISSSTTYRLIDQINEAFEETNFRIETNPCRIEGSEKEIRYFFYNYFHEKYSNLKWPYNSVNEKTLDSFLQFFIEYSHMKADYACYNIFKTISVINFIRYKQGYSVDTSELEDNFKEIVPDLTTFQEEFRYFEEANRIKVNHTFIQQVFTPYIREEFSLNYGRLMEKTKVNPQMSAEVNFLSDLLEELSEKHQLSLNNKKNVVLNVHNASHLEDYCPRSGYILHNYNLEFITKVKKNFPKFYDHLYSAAKNYRKLMGKSLTEDGISFIMYMIFITWENLLPELKRKFEKIHILVVSDHHVSHAEMIKDVIEYEFHEQIIVSIYNGINLNDNILKNLEYDIIVANFPLPTLEHQRSVYVENLPTFFDIAKIRESVDDIILERVL